MRALMRHINRIIDLAITFIHSILGSGIPVGNAKWQGACLAPNGNIYLAPRGVTYSAYINTLTGVCTTFGAIPYIADAYAGIILAQNGMLYCIPRYAGRVLKINPTLNTLTLIGTDYGSGGVNDKWLGGCLGDDGMIYACPFGATTYGNQILKINPNTDTTSLITIPVSGSLKYAGAVLLNSKIYFIPYQAARVLVLDIATQVATLIGSTFSTAVKWQGSSNALNEKIYCCPVTDTRVMVIDPTTNSTTYIGQTLPAGTKYGCVNMAKDGNLYCNPYGSIKMLKINTSNDTTEFIGNTMADGWIAGCIGSNKKLYAMPGNGTTYLETEILGDDVVGDDMLIPADLADLPTSNYNKYYNKF